ncbi:hypothetical protein HAX54_018181, partial [Datura stramonium]|nr:hypothetical protein [Datura stramonium]
PKQILMPSSDHEAFYKVVNLVLGLTPNDPHQSSFPVRQPVGLIFFLQGKPFVKGHNVASG